MKLAILRYDFMSAIIIKDTLCQNYVRCAPLGALYCRLINNNSSVRLILLLTHVRSMTIVLCRYCPWNFIRIKSISDFNRIFMIFFTVFIWIIITNVLVLPKNTIRWNPYVGPSALWSFAFRI